MAKFMMLVGLPGSGKTSYAHEIAKETGAKVLSSDAIRGEIFGDENCQDHNASVFATMYMRTVNYINAGFDVVYDATNISWKRRKELLDKLSGYYCEKVCIVVATPVNVCIENCKMRSRKVSPEVVKRMYKSFQFPGEFEGWDDIQVYYPKTEYMGMINFTDATQLMNGFDQKNPHHEYTLLEHSNLLLNNFMSNEISFKCDRIPNEDALTACLFHDYGKLFTQQIEEGIAKYYSHHNVGAYEAMFVEFSKYTHWGDNEIFWLINNHMEPFFWKNESTFKKYKKLWDDFAFRQIMCIHYCDRISSKEMTSEEKSELKNRLLRMCEL